MPRPGPGALPRRPVEHAVGDAERLVFGPQLGELALGSSAAVRYQIGEGTSQIQRMIIARGLVGHY